MGFLYNSKEASKLQYSCDVAIIGAGLSGLWAGHLLAQEGYNIVILEAKKRLGGRIFTEQTPFSPFIDHGAQYISKGQNRLISLLKKWDFETFPAYESGMAVCIKNGNRTISTPSLKDRDETIRIAKTLNEMTDSVPLHQPWACPKSNSWDNQTLQDWLKQNTESVNARNQIIQSIEGVYQSCPGQTSLLGALFCIKSGDPLEAFLNPELGPELRVQGGVEQLLHKIAEPISTSIILNTSVHTINYEKNTIEILADNVKINAKSTVITLPPSIAGRLNYFPLLPPIRDQLCQRTPQNWVTKIHCTFNNPFWRNEGLSGSVESDTGFAKICVDNSPQSGTPGIILAFIQGPDAFSFSKLSLKEKKETIKSELVHYFGVKAKNMIEYNEKSWFEDPHCRGCYGGYYSCGLWTKCGAALRNSIGPIHFAGTETSAVWNGKMEGAILSAETTVECIIGSV